MDDQHLVCESSSTNALDLPPDKVSDNESNSSSSDTIEAPSEDLSVEDSTDEEEEDSTPVEVEGKDTQKLMVYVHTYPFWCRPMTCEEQKAIRPSLLSFVATISTLLGICATCIAFLCGFITATGMILLTVFPLPLALAQVYVIGLKAQPRYIVRDGDPTTEEHDDDAKALVLATDIHRCFEKSSENAWMLKPIEFGIDEVFAYAERFKGIPITRNAKDEFVHDSPFTNKDADIKSNHTFIFQNLSTVLDVCSNHQRRYVNQ